MAKVQFERTKPHIHVARQRLLQAGMSLAGVEELLQGRLISSPDDRALVAEIVISATSQDTASCWIRLQQPNTGE